MLPYISILWAFRELIHSKLIFFLKLKFLRTNSKLFILSELRAQVGFSNRLMSVVILSVCLSVRLKTFDIFIYFSSNTGPISNKLKLTQSILGWGGYRFVQMKVKALSQVEIMIMYWSRLKLFSRITGPFSTNLGTKYSGRGD